MCWKVKASSDEAQSFIPETAEQEVFTWPSVILPYVSLHTISVSVLLILVLILMVVREEGFWCYDFG